MNGHVRVDKHISDDFEPSSRLNSTGHQIAITLIGEDCEVVTYSAAEARRYAAAFERAAELLEQQDWCPGCGNMPAPGQKWCQDCITVANAAEVGR